MMLTRAFTIPNLEKLLTFTRLASAVDFDAHVFSTVHGWRWSDACGRSS